MKKSTLTKNLHFSREFSMLSSPIVARTIPEHGYLTLMAELLMSHPDERLHQDLQRLLRVPRFRKHFGAELTNLREAAHDSLSIGGMNLLRAWKLAMFSFAEHSEKLYKFSEYRDQVEHLILRGDYLTALDMVADGVARYGESIWFVRTKVLLLSELRRTEELGVFCDDLQSGIDKTLIGSVLRYVRVLTDTDSPLPLLERLIFSASKELKETRYEEFASLLEVLFTPQPLIAAGRYWLALNLIHALSVIDQYIIIERVLLLAVANDELGVPESPIGDLTEQISLVAKITKVDFFQRLAQELVPPLSTDISLKGAIILDLYEKGQYSDVVENYTKSYSSLYDPLAYLNIVAKSYSSIEANTSIVIESPLLQKMLRHLSGIYAMGSNAGNSEDAIKSLAVRFNSMRWCPQLQLCIYKTLPWRYEQKGRNVVGRLAYLSSREVTPLSATIAVANDLMGEPAPPVACLDVPKYRLMKSEIINSLQQEPVPAFVANSMEVYLAQEPRKKDRIEIRSLYQLKTNKDKELLRDAAFDLVNFPAAYLVLPMDRLINLIEQKAYANLDAVIVAFYYYRFISPQKDYVLNEAFDDYLSANAVARPSTLLHDALKVDKMSEVFYKDICIPEVLDYLSCFNNIHELFAERIKILDELSERELIDSNARSAEVEEIVSRVVIETATTNLNGAKIAVDESALRKKLRIEVGNLLEIFHQTQDANDDRFTVTPEQLTSGKAHGYISGARNAIIFRLCKLVIDSFMFDEKFGLDKTLSGEIRHGFFSNLMHARLEEKKLLAETDAQGHYMANQHWREINHLVSQDAMNQIEKVINRFGEELNGLITEAEGWMKIKNGTDGMTGILEYDLPKKDFDSIRRFVEGGNDAEAVCNHIFEILWIGFDRCLAEIRDKLNGVFRDKVDKLFQQLEQDLVHLKRHIAMVELMSAIAQVRNGIREDISTASEWFRRTKSNEIQAGTLEKAVAIAINSFERVKGSIFGIATDLDHNLQQVPIADHHVKPFILAFVNLLDNCYRHSGLWSRTQVRIDGKLEGNVAVLKINNDLSPEKARSLTPDILAAIRSKISNADSLNLIRTEGGSGLVKAFNGISGLGSDMRLDVSCGDGIFSAIIYYGT